MKCIPFNEMEYKVLTTDLRQLVPDEWTAR